MSADLIGKTDDMIGSERAWRVDATSNFNDESYAESVKINWVTEMQAEAIAEILNRGEGDQSLTFYSPRPHGSKLWRGMEELI